MKNVLIISTTEEELLSNVDDGTNRLFVNGSEIPSTDWMGTGNYTATVEGHAITIAKIDVDSLDGLNVSLAKTADYTYEIRKRTPTESQGLYAFSIDNNGHLILTYQGNTPPDFEIDQTTGHLIARF